jgi:GNAT superfamily N-acetyltransferase
MCYNNSARRTRASEGLPYHVSDVRHIKVSEIDDVVDVLWESFHDYPVMRYIIGVTADYDERLRKLMDFFASARYLRSETVLGVGEPGALSGVAMVSDPTVKAPPEVVELRDATFIALGDEAWVRYEEFGAACRPFFEDMERAIHLNMIGVRRSAQGQGVGRRLIDYVHGLSRADRASAGVTLTTEEPTNVAIYQHLGYSIIGHAPLRAGLETWGMFRPDRDES